MRTILMYGETGIMNLSFISLFLYARRNKNYCIKYCIIYTRVDYENLRENIRDYFKRNLRVLFPFLQVINNLT